MKLTRRQLIILIKEAMKKPKNPFDYVEDEEQLKKMKSLLGHEDTSFADTAYQLATTLQKARPDKNQPDPEMYTNVDLGYEGDDYLGDLRAYYESPEGILEFAKKIDQNYLPGFLKLPQEIIDAVVAFVFLSSGPTLHIQLEEDVLEEEIGQDMYERATNYPSRNMPENAYAVEIVDSYRNNPKAHDPKFYSIYAVGGEYKGVDPFTKIDPYLDPNSQYVAHRHGDSQSGFHDGFREEYHKVAEDPKHRNSSYAVEEDIIRMMRDLRPDHEEYVIN